MSSGKKETNVWKRIFDLWASIVKMVQNGARSPEWLANRLQKMVDEPQKKFELYLHPNQRDGGWIKGFDLDRHLHETYLCGRTASLEEPEVKGWLENPETYPEEYKSKAIFLWKSQQDSGTDRGVACLIWDDGQLIVTRSWLGQIWGDRSPVLLAMPAGR